MPPCSALAAEPLGQREGRRRALRSKTAYDAERRRRVFRQGSQGRAGELRPSRPSRHHSSKRRIPRKFGKLTTANLAEAARHLPRSSLLSAPIIQSPIYDSGQITGSFTQEQTVTLANELNAGALPVSVKIIEKETIGPTLGKIDLDSVDARGGARSRPRPDLHDRRLSPARPPGRLRAGDLRARHDGDSRALARDADAARHRRLRALDRYGGRRERADLRAHQRRAVERQDDARRGARRLPARLLGRLRQPLHHDRRRRRALHARHRHGQRLCLHALLGHRRLAGHRRLHHALLRRRAGRQRYPHRARALRRQAIRASASSPRPGSGS